MTRDDIRNDYFNWLSGTVCRNRFSKDISYRKLLMHLHDTEFVWSIPKDHNRAEDGISLRYHFAIQNFTDDSAQLITEYLDGPCSVLEMMVALALHCEKHIMDDPAFGDRTGQWFWGMIVNLGLGSMQDSRYDRRVVDVAMARLLNRTYEPNGKGGLFTVRDCQKDLRRVEIFYQLCWYLDSISDI